MKHAWMSIVRAATIGMNVKRGVDRGSTLYPRGASAKMKNPATRAGSRRVRGGDYFCGCSFVALSAVALSSVAFFLAAASSALAFFLAAASSALAFFLAAASSALAFLSSAAFVALSSLGAALSAFMALSSFLASD